MKILFAILMVLLLVFFVVDIHNGMHYATIGDVGTSIAYFSLGGLKIVQYFFLAYLFDCYE